MDLGEGLRRAFAMLRGATIIDSRRSSVQISPGPFTKIADKTAVQIYILILVLEAQRSPVQSAFSKAS